MSTGEIADRRFGRIPDAIGRSGLSRSELYTLAAENRGLFRKRGVATIVDLIMLDAVLAELPAAEIGRKETTRQSSPAR
jgi:hypothetical protein